MSVRVMAEVWDLDIEAMAKLVLLKLADHADQDGANAYPSVATVARACSITERTAQRWLKWLVEEEWLEITNHEHGGRGRARVYRITLGAGRIKAGGKGDNDDTLSEPLKGDFDDTKGDTDDAKGCHPCHPNHPLTKGNQDARAREAAGGAASPTRACPPANARWKSVEPELRVCPAWPLLQLCVPDDDDGERMRLAVACQGVGWAILQWAAPQAEAILQRKLTVTVRGWVPKALEERGLPRRLCGDPATAREWDGLACALDDADWRRWHDRLPILRDLEAWRFLRRALPHGRREGRLLLGANDYLDFRTAWDGLRGEVEQALGCECKPWMGGWVEQALKVRNGAAGGNGERAA